MTDPTHFNNDDKIDWEVRKLQAEVDAAKRGSARGATYWVPWITALVAVGGFFLQYQDAQSRRQLAAVQLERAEFERDKIDAAVADANAALAKARKELEDVLHERQVAVQDTQAAIEELNAIKSKPATATTSQELQSVGARFDKSLQLQQQLNVKAQASIQSLRPIDISKVRAAKGAGPSQN